MMPGLEGVQVCGKVRALRQPEPPYLIVLTSRDGKEDIVAAAKAAPDDLHCQASSDRAAN